MVERTALILTQSCLNGDLERRVAAVIRGVERISNRLDGRFSSGRNELGVRWDSYVQ